MSSEERVKKSTDSLPRFPSPMGDDAWAMERERWGRDNPHADCCPRTIYCKDEIYQGRIGAPARPLGRSDYKAGLV
jgi:hypothetical protein